MRKLIPIILLCTISWSCKKDNPKAIPNPSKALLSFPAQNEACTTGTIISATKSSVEFKWNKSENTDNYELVLKNLESGAVIHFKVIPII